jgi:hypothetical protein
MLQRHAVPSTPTTKREPARELSGCCALVCAAGIVLDRLPCRHCGAEQDQAETAAVRKSDRRSWFS